MSMKTILVAAGLLAPTLVFAGNCPNLMTEVDDILANSTNLDAETREAVTALRDEGEQQHQAGDHGKSVETLEKALEMLDGAS